jgi:hypothetical protein
MTPMTTLAHLTRAFTFAGATSLSYIASVHVIVAQTLPGVEDSNLIKFIEKGGGWTVLLVVLWAYRRDYIRLTEGDAERNKQLIAILEKSANATLDVAVALSRNTEVMRAQVAAMQGHHYEPREQRREDLRSDL